MIEKIKSLLTEIDKLRKKYPYDSDQTEFDTWQKELENLGEAESIKENAIIKQMIEKAQTSITGAYEKLHTFTSDKLPDKQRDSLIAQVEGYTEFLNNFANIDKQVEDSEKKIREAIDHYNNLYPHQEGADN